MATCPKCQKEIDHLVNWTTARTPYVMSADADYEPHPTLEPIPVMGDVGDTFDCPECYEELFQAEKVALAFLSPQVRVA